MTQILSLSSWDCEALAWQPLMVRSCSPWLATAPNTAARQTYLLAWRGTTTGTWTAWPAPSSPHKSAWFLLCQRLKGRGHVAPCSANLLTYLYSAQLNGFIASSQAANHGLTDVTSVWSPTGPKNEQLISGSKSQLIPPTTPITNPSLLPDSSFR